ncbi:hypothetical protein [Staphylococcus haemolyticus]
MGGWGMAVEFRSMKEEDNGVRYEVGMLDVRDMGEMCIKGNDGSKFVE